MEVQITMRLVVGDCPGELLVLPFDQDYRGTVRSLILMAEIRDPRYGKADLHHGKQSCQTELFSSTAPPRTDGKVLQSPLSERTRRFKRHLPSRH